jgi:hypothetical protein
MKSQHSIDFGVLQLVKQIMQKKKTLISKEIHKAEHELRTYNFFAKTIFRLSLKQ